VSDTSSASASSAATSARHRERATASGIRPEECEPVGGIPYGWYMPPLTGTPLPEGAAGRVIRRDAIHQWHASVCPSCGGSSARAQCCLIGLTVVLIVVAIRHRHPPRAECVPTNLATAMLESHTS